MMKGFLQWLAFALVASVLSACGGGGGGSPSPDPTPTPTNSAPVAPDVSGEVVEDTPRTITLPGTDADGNTLTYSKVTNPAHGTVTVSGDQATYTPATNYHGSDSFTWKVNDGTADSNVATVSITVTPVNDAPTAGALSATTDEDVAKPITLAGADVDTGDTLTYIKVSDPAHGTVSISGNVATYTPEANSYYLSSPDAQRLNGYFSVDSFTYKVSDGMAESAVATVSVTVNPVNDAPVSGGSGSAQMTGEDTAKTFTLPGYDPDQVSSTLTGAISTQPQHGSVTVSGNQATYTPAANFAGTDTFGYTLSDGSLSSAESFITIVVGGVNDPPTADAGADQEATEGETVNLSGSGTDIDSVTLTYSWVQTDSSGVTATLTGENTATPSFTAPEVTADTTLTFTLTVSDEQGGSATDSVSIVVKDMPGVVPTLSDFNASVNENSPEGTTIGNIDVVNGGDSAIVEFTLSDNTYFEIDSSGNIKTKGSLDYETKPVHNLTATAKNASGNSPPVNVNITVNDMFKLSRLSSANISGNAFGVTLSNDGTKAYVANRSSGLMILDITNPSAPILLGSYDTDALAPDTNEFALDVKLSRDGTKAFVATEEGGLVVLDYAFQGEKADNSVFTFGDIRC